MTTPITDLQAHWPPIAPVFLLRTEEEYDAAVARLNALVAEIGTNEAHPLYGLLDTLGTLIHTYEAEHHAVPDTTGPEILQFLMEEHDISTSDIPELGSAETVERYLAGKMELGVSQVRAIAQKFHISPAAFI